MADSGNDWSHVEKIDGRLLLPLTAEDTKTFFSVMNDIAAANKNLEYYTWADVFDEKSGKNTLKYLRVTMDSCYIQPIGHADDTKERIKQLTEGQGLVLDDFPLASEWRNAARKINLPPIFYILLNRKDQLQQGLHDRQGDRRWLADVPWCSHLKDALEEIRKLENNDGSHFRSLTLARYIEKDIEPNIKYAALRNIVLAFMGLSPDRERFEDHVHRWITYLEEYAYESSDDNFTDFFTMVHDWGYGPNGNGCLLCLFRLQDYARARELSIVPDADLIRMMNQSGVNNTGTLYWEARDAQTLANIKRRFPSFTEFSSTVTK